MNKLYYIPLMLISITSNVSARIYSNLMHSKNYQNSNNKRNSKATVKAYTEKGIIELLADSILNFTKNIQKYSGPTYNLNANNYKTLALPQFNSLKQNIIYTILHINHFFR